VIPVADILHPLEEAAEAVLNFFHDNVGLSWGTSIIALTVCVRAVLIPLTYKQIKGMRALQALQPQIKAIQEKYKNDRQRQQQEMMRFYQENKINPLASCLPLLLQLPIFFALFRTLRGDNFQQDVEAAGGAGWFFISSVIEKPQGAELIVLMVLFAGSMALSTFITMRSSPTAAGSQQYVMLGAFALVGLFFVPAVPAGLSLYWITTNFWTVGQSYAAAKLIPPPAVPTLEEAAAAKPPPPPPKKKKRRR
jgi:YidC/Oxa1 family membrane protein insertase